MGISELESFYSNLNFDAVSEARSPSPPPPPHIPSFSTDTAGSKVQFSYIQYTDPNPETRAVSIASTRDNWKVVVKFAEAYNQEAHGSLLATKGLAPRLRSCDRSTFRNFVMVVMDYVDGKQSFHNL